MSKKQAKEARDFKLSEPIWEQGEHEPALWFQRFMSFLQMSKKRTVLGVYKKERLVALNVEADNYEQEKARIGKIKCPPGAWSEASNLYKWRKRAEAFDDHQLLEDQEHWKERHRKDREQEHQRGSELMQRAKEMLSYALAKVEHASGVEVVTEPGRKAEIIAQLREAEVNEKIIGSLEEMPIMIVSITQLQPVRWQMRDAPILAEVGARLMRQATGAPTSYQQHEVFGGKGKDGQPSSLFPIKEIIIKQAPKKELPGMNGDVADSQQQEEIAQTANSNINDFAEDED
jgi:hypothetical protein